MIDGNGLGLGLLDYMIKPSSSSNKIYPAYGCKNDDNYIKIQPKDAPKIIYVIKAGGTNDGKIHSNCYSRLTSGLVQFLVSERLAKEKLLEQKSYKKLPLDKKVARLMPHELTSDLFEEMNNLRLKNNTGLDIKLELIRTTKTKDKFSAFEYGLWRIKELEDELNKKQRRGKNRTLCWI